MKVGVVKRLLLYGSKTDKQNKWSRNDNSHKLCKENEKTQNKERSILKKEVNLNRSKQ